MLTSRLQQKDTGSAAQEFYCPNCHTRRSYEWKGILDVHMVCVIPLFETKDLTQVIECQSCKNGFDPEILQPGNQSLFRLVATTRNQLLNGTSPGSLKVRMMSDGLKEELIDQLIGLAQN
jgi:hypothetical protein